MFCIIQNAEEGKIACSHTLPSVFDQNFILISLYYFNLLFYFDALLVVYGDSPQKWVIIGCKFFLLSVVMIGFKLHLAFKLLTD